jgi:hypothetical protein
MSIARPAGEAARAPAGWPVAAASVLGIVAVAAAARAPGRRVLAGPQSGPSLSPR